MKRKALTNEQLMYDPDMDTEDQKWVDGQRWKCHPKKTQSKSKQNRKEKLPQSDAVLNCPACMITLCRDCQR